MSDKKRARLALHPDRNPGCEDESAKKFIEYTDKCNQPPRDEYFTTSTPYRGTDNNLATTTFSRLPAPTTLPIITSSTGRNGTITRTESIKTELPPISNETFTCASLRDISDLPRFTL